MKFAKTSTRLGCWKKNQIQCARFRFEKIVTFNYNKKFRKVGIIDCEICKLCVYGPRPILCENVSYKFLNIAIATD